MNRTIENIQFYQQQIQLSEAAIQKEKSNYRLWAMIRLAIFLSMAIGAYFSWGKWLIVVSILLVGIIAFLLAISKFQDAKTALSKAKKWKEIIQEELNAIETQDYSYFEDGSSFKDAKHAFSYDMDIFGKGSIFSFINRTFSTKGKTALAQLLTEGAESPEKVNEMIKGLSQQMDWNTKFRVNGSIDERAEALEVNLMDFSKFTIQTPKWLNVGRFVLSTLGLSALIAFIFSLISGWTLAGVLIVNMLFVGKYLKSTNHTINVLTKYDGKVKFLLDQMHLTQSLQTDNPTLQEFVNRISQKGDGAIDVLKSLLKIQNKFEYRMNLLVGFVLNSLVVWDIHQRIGLEKWLENNANRIGEWEADFILLEAYISGGILLFNHPETVFAEWNNEDTIQVTSLKHPLISKEKVVGNDVHFDENKRMMILTGPNMAGKSTYLRAVGLMFVFANAGFPVFANKVNIPHYRLFTSMRTSDDITTDSSYFYAELSRLKFILNQIEKDQKIFILLDEILKGTNSIDKEQGSKQFLSKLQRLDSKGIIATHDLSLCELSENSHYFYNGYFDSIIQDDELFFDYIWREGVCQNMNASFLLKKMKLVD